MPPVKKPGVTCTTHGSARIDKGTNCRNPSPSAGIAGLVETYWKDAVKAEKQLVDDVAIRWARLFNPKKAADFSIKHAKHTPVGLCARYSTAAITAGFGVEEKSITSLLGVGGASSSYVALLMKHLGLGKIVAPNSAKDYGRAVLVPLGFESIATLPADRERDEIIMPEDYYPTIGDVIIFPANPQAKDRDGNPNVDGHMQICTDDFVPGGQWISDGHQKTVLPNSDLAKGWQKVGFVIYQFAMENLIFEPITIDRRKT